MITIYIFTVRSTGKSYIGQTIFLPSKRLRQHFNEARRCNPERRTKWHRAIIKYGVDDIEIGVIDACEHKCAAATLERRAIARYNTIEEGYNTHEGGFGGRTRSPEQLEELRLQLTANNPAKRADVKEKIVRSLAAYRQSNAYKENLESTRERRRQRMLGERNHNYRRPMSEVTKAKMVETKRGKRENLQPHEKYTKRYLITTPDGSTHDVLGQDALYALLASYGHNEWAFRKVIRGETAIKGASVGWTIQTVVNDVKPVR